MLQTLIVGLGRAGRDLHVPVVQKARELDGFRHLFANSPIVGVDPYRLGALEGVVITDSVVRARELSDPAHTVVHLCTPLDIRSVLMEQLCSLGYRRLIVEKPFAADERDLERMASLCHRYKVRPVVVAPWFASALTIRMTKIIADGALGQLRSIRIVQRKPRFTKSITNGSCSSALDVELPHSVGIALLLAGPAEVHDAAWSDMRMGEVVVPRMGGAWLTLEHECGVRTEIYSDLTSPKRERAITLELAEGTLTGHYSCSEADSTAQLMVSTGGRDECDVFDDDALTTFMVGTYQHFVAPGCGGGDELELNSAVVRILSQARRLCARVEVPSRQHRQVCSAEWS